MASTENPSSAVNKDSDPSASSKDLKSQLETGGLSNFRELDHVITRVVQKVEDAIKVEINKLKPKNPIFGKDEKLEIVGYRMNIVNGYMYFAKIKIHGDSFIQARILESPKGEVTLQTVTETKTEADELDYFKIKPPPSSCEKQEIPQPPPRANKK